MINYVLKIFLFNCLQERFINHISSSLKSVFYIQGLGTTRFDLLRSLTNSLVALSTSVAHEYETDKFYRKSVTEKLLSLQWKYSVFEIRVRQRNFKGFMPMCIERYFVRVMKNPISAVLNDASVTLIFTYISKVSFLYHIIDTKNSKQAS